MPKFDFVLEPRCAPAVITWLGAGITNNCSEAANWLGGVVPVAADTIVFDGEDSNKDATIDANFTAAVSGLDVRDDYAGTITVTRNFAVGSGHQDSGTVTVSQGVTLTVANFQLSKTGDIDAKISGPGELFLHSAAGKGAWTWSGGTLNFLDVTVSETTTGTFSGIVAANLIELRNKGTIEQNNQRVDASGTTFINEGTWTSRTAAFMETPFSNPPVVWPCNFANSGTFKVEPLNEGTHTTLHWKYWANPGCTTQIMGGATLRMMSSQGSIHSGNLVVNAGATLTLLNPNAAHQFTHLVDYSGLGTLEVQDGAEMWLLDGLDLYIPGTLKLKKGDSVIPSSIRGDQRIGASSFIWEAGVVSVTEIWQPIGSFADLTTAGEKVLSDTVFKNYGTLRWYDGDITMLGSPIVETTNSTGVFRVYCDKSINNVNAATGKVKFSNDGAFYDNGWAPDINVEVENNGGRLYLDGDTRFGANFTQTSGSTSIYGAVSVVGDFDMSGGTLTVSGTQASLTVDDDFTQSGGSASFTGATLTAEDIDVSGGQLSLFANNTFTADTATIGQNAVLKIQYGGFFNVDDFVNAGVIEFGSSGPTYFPGSLIQYARDGSSTASFLQTSSGRSKFFTAGGAMGALDIHGDAVVGGYADLIAVNGYQVTPGATFGLLNADMLTVSCGWTLPPLPPGPPPPWPQWHWVSHFDTISGRQRFWWRVE